MTSSQVSNLLLFSVLTNWRTARQSSRFSGHKRKFHLWQLCSMLLGFQGSFHITLDIPVSYLSVFIFLHLILLPSLFCCISVGLSVFLAVFHVCVYVYMFVCGCSILCVFYVMCVCAVHVLVYVLCLYILCV